MLTDTALKNLKPKEKPYNVADRDGMYVVVAPSGTITCRVDYRSNDRRETVTLGKYGPAELSTAEMGVSGLSASAPLAPIPDVLALGPVSRKPSAGRWCGGRRSAHPGQDSQYADGPFRVLTRVPTLDFNKEVIPPCRADRLIA